MNNTKDFLSLAWIIKTFRFWLLAGPALFLASIILSSPKETAGFILVATVGLSFVWLLMLGSVNIFIASFMHQICKRFNCSIAFEKITLMLIWITLSGLISLGMMQEERPEAKFRMLVLDPIPPSVRNIEYGGVKPFSGWVHELKFDISPQDLDKIIQSGGFKKVELPEISEKQIAEMRKRRESPKSILYYRLGNFTPHYVPYVPLVEPEAYQLDPPKEVRVYDFTGILTNKAHTKVYFFHSYE
jgi:hypothetical protein